MSQLPRIIIANNLDLLGSSETSGYVAHALCTGGSCKFSFNMGDYEMSAGDLIIVRQGRAVCDVQPSADFQVKAVYVEVQFLEVCTPQNNYGMKGTLSLFLNPLMRLDEVQQQLCLHDMLAVETRWNSPHNFHRDIMIATVQAMFLDFFDFHVNIYGEHKDVPLQTATIMSRFMAMLENGDYVRHREVSYYADALCVTPKYLSEVSKKASGQSANYWINRYTSLEISRLLRDKSLTIASISDRFDFSSPAYFTRYVQNNLGMTPSEYRE